MDTTQAIGGGVPVPEYISDEYRIRTLNYWMKYPASMNVYAEENMLLNRGVIISQEGIFSFTATASIQASELVGEVITSFSLLDNDGVVMVTKTVDVPKPKNNIALKLSLRQDF